MSSTGMLGSKTMTFGPRSGFVGLFDGGGAAVAVATPDRAATSAATMARPRPRALRPWPRVAGPRASEYVSGDVIRIGPLSGVAAIRTGRRTNRTNRTRHHILLSLMAWSSHLWPLKRAFRLTRG